VLVGEGRAIECAWERGLESALGPTPGVERLADWLVALCARHGASRILLDGPQAWKDPANGLVHQRLCERALATQAKTGPPGVVKPGTQRRFVELSIALFDALDARGFPRFDPARPEGAAAVEVFPTACWRALGARALPAKRACVADELARAGAFLANACGVRLRGAPTHDELQAAVAGLAGLALAGHGALAWRAYGVAPYRVDGSWREGAIVVAEPANSSR
jgi:hypothetical protein